MNDYTFVLEQEACPICGGPLLVFGILGNRVHFQCRDCGAEMSREVQQ